ncbi:MAG: hypothetical protein IPJ81_18210 [Chitinophagaceae bacterium]|nr:hypothetical protein [Chitinophagaceae bacterium]
MAFIVDGNNKGKYIYIELQKSGSQKQAKAALENNGEVTAEDIDEEIERIKSREKRFKELDQVKVWDNLKPHFNPHANASLLKEEFTQVEREAIAFAIFNKLSYNERDNFRSLFKIKKENFSDVDEITFTANDPVFLPGHITTYCYL